MGWTSYNSRTGQRTYIPGGSPYDAFGPGGGPGFSRQIAHEGSSHYTYSGSGSTLQRWDWVADQPSTPTAVAPPAQASVVTGINPSEIHNALYGKIIPLSALGLARIGTAGLIWGPYFNSGAASFAVSFGFPANVAGTRRVYEVSLDSKVAWELAAGSPAGDLDPAGFIGDPFTCRFYAGTMTQPADPLEIAVFGAEAVAYRPQMMLWFTLLDVEQFDGKVPFVSCKIGDVTDGAVPADGINLGEALERVAYSPWLEYDSSSFETSGIADIVQAMILTEDQSFLNMLQVTARVYRTLDIIQTDMLRVNDRGSTVAPDLSLHRDHIAADGGVQFIRQEEASVPRELELITIDPDVDFVFIPSKAARPLAPVPVTSSVGKDSITLPVVIGATTRASLVTFAKYQEDNARRRVSLQTMACGYQLEPGDLFNLADLAVGFDPGEIWKVVETNHGANYINEIIGEAILKCALYTDPDVDPYFADVILLLHGNGSSPVVDSSGYANAMALAGGAQINTAVKKFGAGAFLFDGVDSSVQTVSSMESEWSISPTNTSPYTIELWARFDQVPLAQNQTLIARNTGFLGIIFHLYLPSGTDDLIYGTSSSSAAFTATHHTMGADLIGDTWYHIAVDKDSTGCVRIYINGVMRHSDTPANSVMGNFLCWIGVGTNSAAAPGGTTSNPFKGNIDEVRITTVSRYGDLYGDGPFSVPTSPFPDHA